MGQAALMDPSLGERLWREHADALLLYVTTFIGDAAAAEDALQSLFTKLLALDRLPAMESERSYLFRAIRNEAISDRRKASVDERVRGRLFEAGTRHSGAGRRDDLA